MYNLPLSLLPLFYSLISYLSSTQMTKNKHFTTSTVKDIIYEKIRQYCIVILASCGCMLLKNINIASIVWISVPLTPDCAVDEFDRFHE